MHERFVIVHRTHDPIQADLLGDLLRGGGVTARVIGTRSAAAIGVGQSIVQIYIEVPESQAGQATDFLEAFFSGDGIEALPGEFDLEADGDDRDAEPAVASPGGERPLRPLLAAGTAFLTFGVGHLYARRGWTAAALAAGQVVALYFLFGGRSWDDWTVGVTLMGGLLACDVIGAPLAVRSRRRGLRRGVAWQSAVGLVYVAASMGLALVVGPRLAQPGDGHGGQHDSGLHPVRPGRLERPFQKDPAFPPLTSQHPANPFARQ